MNYIQRLLEKKRESLGVPTYKTYETQETGRVDALIEGLEKNTNSYSDSHTKPTKPSFVGFVGTQLEESSEIQEESPGTWDMTVKLTGRATPPPPWTPRPAELANWPIPWREKWGRLANDLQDEGVPWPEHERRAFHQVKAEKEARKAP